MIPPAAFRKLQSAFRARETARRETTARSNDALNRSKRAIFALHRNDLPAARRLLRDVDVLFRANERTARRFPVLAYEGAYRAALEEYAEALLFEQYLTHGKFGPIEPRAMDADVYLSGLCDATGEIVRHAIRRATDGDVRAVHAAANVVEMTITYLLDLDLSGYLRTKFDQAKKNHRQLEQMLYELRA